ncbi:MAG: 50S ribosomal protein L29 [Candidatus Cloacimonadales bacterium]|jgi:large subunit ribosomal protein L29|nr:50S ribosomal protein L29 [Candidatus Cloacimonadota bacterium]MDD3501291.1 50S ribosomal protein L29 [Candidatus Cloacimonadota bacterium]MDX9977387.1 50S ribosomal protein L29 [Candidatus Cloacimonadales bacterium]
MKAAELRDLTIDELNKRVEDFKEELFNLRIQKVRNRLENTSRIKDVRRDIARTLTIITEKNNAIERS